jgi:hypothetical protein
MASYKVLVGLDYGDKRAEAGDVVSDLPTKSITWLKEQGLIEEVATASKTTSKTTKVEEQVEGEAQ